MIDAWTIYWVMQADSIKAALVGVTILMVFAAIGVVVDPITNHTVCVECPLLFCASIGKEKFPLASPQVVAIGGSFNAKSA